MQLVIGIQNYSMKKKTQHNSKDTKKDCGYSQNNILPCSAFFFIVLFLHQVQFMPTMLAEITF